MIDALLDIFSDIVDFFADLWINKIVVLFVKKKEEKKTSESEIQKSDEE